MNRIKHGFAGSELFQYFDIFRVRFEILKKFQFGSIEQIRTNSVEFDSVRFDSVRFDAIRFVSVRYSRKVLDFHCIAMVNDILATKIKD